MGHKSPTEEIMLQRGHRWSEWDLMRILQGLPQLTAFGKVKDSWLSCCELKLANRFVLLDTTIQNQRDRKCKHHRATRDL